MSSKNAFSAVALAMLFLVANIQRGACQQPSEIQEESGGKIAAATSSTPPGDAVEASNPPKITGRLPRYFAAVVNAAQRMEIYTIQAGYREQIEVLQQQLEELRLAELAAVEKVLTKAQLEQVVAMREAARQRAMLRARGSTAEVVTDVEGGAASASSRLGSGS